MKVYAIFGVLIALLLTSCQHPAAVAQKTTPQATDPSRPPLYEWPDNEPTQGTVHVKIHLSEQKAYFYTDQQSLGWSYVATGRRGYSTPSGRYSIMEKRAVKRSNLYGKVMDAEGNVINWDASAKHTPVPPGGRFQGASMPYWMRLTGYGVGMHAGPIPRPGHPASHGCIRLPRPVAEKLYAVTDSSTRVTIIP